MKNYLLKIACVSALVCMTNLVNAQEIIKIGAPLALTGGLADEGKKQQIAYNMWLKKVKAAGGRQGGNKKRKGERSTEEEQTDEKRAQARAEKRRTTTTPSRDGSTKRSAAYGNFRVMKHAS